jgi:NAD+ kinase
MKIALFGKTFNTGFNPYIKELFDLFESQNIDLIIYKPFLDYIKCQTGEERAVYRTFNSYDDFDRSCDLIVSIGGDGTFLESIPYVIRQQIPIIGINSGRLGFLANISKENITEAFQSIFEGNFTHEFRSLICFRQPEGLFDGLNYALNDITIKSKSTLVTIDAFINNEFLNTYWTDGLIISTPTGSTAYSLSVGGPIVVPGSDNLIIAPIASHNLTVRPLIIPDTNVISLKVSTRKGPYTISADNRSMEVHTAETFQIGISEHKLKMIKLPKTSFYETLRNKLKWGEDVRN